ncbi:uncharacterized protein EI97DRAFT_433733 [Westerdykella ornata]|uniref:SCP domain-containing protein n=1 Tax=Westerdykella ornata TaxID=318751 RepID=A0A6A6JIL7_WESOR|nr:uncharacterized protein EI97DRAFT_433733 [Westerdykella ornata]KAF2275788.1 hypothetical protein EI97DRAFT_433733 [Westerdykella ornata]
MVSFKTLSLLGLASSAIAAPTAGRPGHKKVVWHTVIHTEYVTIYPGKPTAAPAQPTEQKAQPTTTLAYQAPPPPPPPSSTKVVVVTPTPVVKEPEYQPPANAGYMATVDEWRGKLGLAKLAVDAQLEANALKTCKDGNGQMVHQLNPGTMGQVLAPGGPEDFYHVFVGGWLCERPDMPGLNGVCAEASKGWYYTSTGHADILVSDKYKTIGCANYNGIWSCDLGY